MGVMIQRMERTLAQIPVGCCQIGMWWLGQVRGRAVAKEWRCKAKEEEESQGRGSKAPTVF